MNTNTFTFGISALAVATLATPAPQILKAAAAITIAPMILVYLLLCKQIITGVSRGGTKGKQKWSEMTTSLYA